MTYYTEEGEPVDIERDIAGMLDDMETEWPWDEVPIDHLF